jgi:hypothetical protein
MPTIRACIIYPDHAAMPVYLKGEPRQKGQRTSL